MRHNGSLLMFTGLTAWFSAPMTPAFPTYVSPAGTVMLYKDTRR